jgi:hypothetical protein
MVALIMSTIQLLLGRHGPDDHYLGGRYHPPGHARRRPGTLPFRLSARTVHLFERTVPRQRLEPVPAESIFPELASRYERTAVAFAHRIEQAGGRSYNVESRPTEELDRRYAELGDAAERADLAFFKRPTYAAYLALGRLEEELGALREDLIEANVRHFAAAGLDVVARLGRSHSRVRRLGRCGFVVRTRIGPGSFFPEQILKRRAIFGLEVCEEDRLRGYIDRLLRIVPIWSRGLKLPPHRVLLALRGEELASVRDRFEAAVHASRSLPGVRDLLAILQEVSGYRPDPGAPEDPRFARLRASQIGRDSTE